MNILTVSASPCLTTKLSRINGDILRFFKSQGHHVGSAIWDHDTSWFTPDNNRFYYDTEKNGRVCELFPFTHQGEYSSPQVYEIMKKFQPDLVISIGDYQETDFIFGIKSMYPHLFKWVSILTIDAVPINESRKEAFDYIDLTICTNHNGASSLLKQFNRQSVVLPYGPNPEFFIPLNLPERQEKFVVMNACKNSQASNTAAFIQAVGIASKEIPLTAYLHTNVFDAGDYDLHLLIDRYEVKDILKLPTNFCGLNDGISDEDLNVKYNEASVYVDLSVRASTGLTCLEAMSAGCSPIVSGAGVLNEIAGRMSTSLRHFVSSVSYIGEFEEEYSIACPTDAAACIIDTYSMWKNDFSKFQEISCESENVAGQFSRFRFIQSLFEEVEKLMKRRSSLSVETVSANA